MNSLKIEMGAILAIKNIIQLSDRMKDYINDNDKEPSWDGFIYLYSSDDLKVENIQYKIPVQIKGKNDEGLLKKQRISYAVEYKHLRNYYNDGGVFYIVVAISDDKRETSIFYNALTTVKLDNLLKGKEDKGPDQTKNIALNKLKKTDDSTFLKVLAQFGLDRQKQGSGKGEIIEKAININMLDKVDSIRFTSYISTNEVEALKQISEGELCLYGHRSDLDMWLPFDYEQQRELKLRKILYTNWTIGVDGISYYDKCIIEQQVHENSVIRVSENLIIDLLNGKLNFEMHGNIQSLKKDADFLNAVLHGHSFWIENKKVSTFTNANIPNSLEESLGVICDFYNGLQEINFECDKKADDFSMEDWESVLNLVGVYRREIKIDKGRNNDWYIWHWEGKVIPLLLVQDDKGDTQVINWLAKEGYVIFRERESGEKFRLPKGILLKRDVWEKLYDIDENLLLVDIERSEFSEKTMDDIYIYFVDILWVYDKTKNEKYFDMATLLIKKLLEFNKEDENGIINYFQLLKRKRELSGDEIAKLEQLEEKTTNDMIICAINILLENKQRAKKLINQLSDENREMFKQFPIYNLL